GVSRKNECCFGEVHFARNGLHFGLVQASRVVDHRERVPFEGLRRKDIKLRECKLPWVACHGDWIGTGGTKVQDFAGWKIENLYHRGHRVTQRTPLRTATENRQERLSPWGMPTGFQRGVPARCSLLIFLPVPPLLDFSL